MTSHITKGPADARRLTNHEDRRIIYSQFGSLVDVQTREKYNLKSWLTRTGESANGKKNERK
jgi:hypothetical protein